MGRLSRRSRRSDARRCARGHGIVRHGRDVFDGGVDRGDTVAQIAKAFGMDLLAWGPTLTDARARELGATRMDLDPLLESADVVSVHLKLSDESRGLLDEKRLRRIGPRGILVNTARGAIVDEAALARALADGSLGGAGLDVFVEEPLPRDSCVHVPDPGDSSVPDTICGCASTIG